MNRYELGALLLANSVANLKRSSTSRKFALTSRHLQSKRPHWSNFKQLSPCCRVQPANTMNVAFLLFGCSGRQLCCESAYAVQTKTKLQANDALRLSDAALTERDSDLPLRPQTPSSRRSRACMPYAWMGPFHCLCFTAVSLKPLHTS